MMLEHNYWYLYDISIAMPRFLAQVILVSVVIVCSCHMVCTQRGASAVATRPVTVNEMALLDPKQLHVRETVLIK